MELEDKENGDVIEGEDQLGWSFFSGVKLVWVICYKQVCGLKKQNKSAEKYKTQNIKQTQ